MNSSSHRWPLQVVEEPTLAFLYQGHGQDVKDLGRTLPATLPERDIMGHWHHIQWWFSSCAVFILCWYSELTEFLRHFCHIWSIVHSFIWSLIHSYWMRPFFVPDVFLSAQWWTKQLGSLPPCSLGEIQTSEKVLVSEVQGVWGPIWWAPSPEEGCEQRPDGRGWDSLTQRP